jgi:hypothetical protein
VRRRYKVDTTRRRRMLPGEVPHVKNMVVILHVAHYTQVQIAKIIGISRTQVKEFLDDAEVAAAIVELRERLPGAALELLQGYMIEAVQAIVDVIRTTPDDKVIVQAAAEILDRGGLAKLSRSERYQVNDERTTITDDGIVDRLRELPPEQQEEAAQIVEKLEALLAQSAEGAVEEESEDA